MKRKKNIIRAILVMTICVATQAGAQDIHFSQFYETAILRNPALTGIFTEDYKVSGMYRSQWGSISKPFRTMQVSAEMRMPIGREVSDYLSIGLLGFSDKAGQINFRTSAFYPAINYNKSLEDNHSSFLSVGFTGGYIQRSIDLSKMTFDNQYGNPGGGSGEQMPNPKIAHWDLGAGVSFNSSMGPDNRSSWFVGFSGYHFTNPKESFYEENNLINLKTRWNLNGGLNLGLDETWNLLLHGNYMLQGSYQEIMAGGLVRWSRFNSMNRRDFAFSMGGFYRVKDAIIPTVKIEYKGQTFAASYDVNISSLKTATNLRGGLEITVFTSGFFGGNVDDKHLCPRF